MTTATATQTRIPAKVIPALTAYGATQTGRRLPDGTQPAALPAGWTASGEAVPAFIRDEHGRTRISISWIGSKPEALVHAPSRHADEVAERGATLVLDAWAKPYDMIGRAAERVTTFRDLIAVTDQQIARWSSEQPDHAAKLRADHSRYAAKLAAWTGLFDQLAEAVRTAPTR
ncbi:hypothetical protein ACFVAF_25350 [Streptomyces sp. NPDC057596]|uniref:hypothetical protein n=1 Tax=Streptomyces sp. NPDC057596 TaxID=3346178 RepID=UPI0036BA5D69